MHKKIIVVHSGGMDSSLCLALAIREFGNDAVLSLSFDYKHRHKSELASAAKICCDWNVDHTVIELACLSQITRDALTDPTLEIVQNGNNPPNTLVAGRNGLMARLAAIHAHSLGARLISLGVIEVEEAGSGYRDCSRSYMDLMQQILCIDLDDPEFEILTPIVNLNKKETLELADSLGILEYLLRNTITCYNGIPLLGCQKCPSCQLRNDGLKAYLKNHDFVLPNIFYNLV